MFDWFNFPWVCRRHDITSSHQFKVAVTGLQKPSPAKGYGKDGKRFGMVACENGKTQKQRKCKNAELDAQNTSSCGRFRLKTSQPLTRGTGGTMPSEASPGVRSPWIAGSLRWRATRAAMAAALTPTKIPRPCT
jgi:hypothetical protein